MPALGAIDVPVNGQLVAREGFLIEGFAVDQRAGSFQRIAVLHDGVEIGSSTVHYRRPDVVDVIPGADVACGYRVFVALPSDAPERNLLTVQSSFPDGGAWELGVTVTAGLADYRTSPYGTLVDPAVEVVYHRSDIYGVGPPSMLPSEECVTLLKGLLNPGDTVIDVGCGVGAYAPPMFAHGVVWQGCEVNTGFVADMLARGLPAVQVSGPRLPFSDAAFDAAMCVEVLEHVADIDSFIEEVSRVCRHRAIFSVPNAEAIPILADRLLVPWHLLEADHKNFFNRASLCAALSRCFSRVEIVPYGVMPVASSNGTAVYYHLLAVAVREQ
jgi:SAM-dependent methyltransferase